MTGIRTQQRFHSKIYQFEEMSLKDFIIPTAKEMALAQKLDEELETVRLWIEKKKKPSADPLAGLSSRRKCFAEIFDELRVSTVNVLVGGSNSETLNVATIVPKILMERVIRCYYKRPGSSHHAVQAKAAKIVRTFYWPAMNWDIKIYIVGCTECDKFLKLCSVPQAELHPMTVSGWGDCLAINIIGGQGFLLVTSRCNKYIFSLSLTV